MPTTLTATPDVANAGVLLDLRVDAGVEFDSLIRSDANGAAPVRLLAGQGIDSGALVVVDYEAALIGPITYTFTDTTGATTVAGTTLAGLGIPSQLTAPLLPAYSVALDLVTDLRDETVPSGGVHPVIGRIDPIVTHGPMGTRAGTLELWAASYTDAAAIRRAYDRGAIVLLRDADVPGVDLYHTATRVVVEPQPVPTLPRRWRVTVDYVGTARPAGPLLGTLGWDFDAVTATYPDFDTVRATYATFADLAVGPVGA